MQTTMQAEQAKSDLERALVRAIKQGVRIVGKGTRRSDGAPIVAVSSSSEPNRAHVVVVGLRRLSCDCYAGRRDQLCTHRALVHHALLEGWRRARDRVEAEAEVELQRALRELHATLQARDRALARAAGEVRADHTPRAETMKGGVRAYRPDVTQLLGDVADGPTVRGYRDVEPIGIFKR